VKRPRLGMKGYARVLRSLYDSPCTTVQLNERLGLSRLTGATLMAGLHTMGRVHVSGWDQPRKRPTVPVWHYGSGDDAPCPPNRSQYTVTSSVNRRKNFTGRIARPGALLIAFESVLEALEHRPVALREVALETGIDYQVVRRLIDFMASPGVRMVYVAEWVRRFGTGGQPIPLYRLGFDRRDAPRIANLTDAERNQRWRERKRVSDGQFPKRLAPNASVFNLRA